MKCTNQTKMIVVRLPNWLGDVVMSLPFCCKLLDDIQEWELYQRGKIKLSKVKLIFIGPPSVSDWFMRYMQSYIKKYHQVHVSLTWIDFHRSLYSSIKGLWAFKQKNVYLEEADQWFLLAPSLSSVMMAKFFFPKKIIGLDDDTSQAWIRNIFLHFRVKNKKIIKHRSLQYLDLLNHRSLIDRNENRNHAEDIVMQDSHDIKLQQYGLERLLNHTHPGYFILHVNSEASSRKPPFILWRKIVHFFRYELQGVPYRLIFTGISKETSYVHSFFEMLNKEECEICLDMTGKTNLLQLHSLMKRSLGLISSDSGPAHFANAIGVPVFVFFGAGDARETAPCSFRNPVYVYSGSLSCSPCLKNICPLKTLDCLSHFDLDDLKIKLKLFFGLS